MQSKAAGRPGLPVKFWAQVSNGQNTESPKYNDNISVLIFISGGRNNCNYGGYIQLIYRMGKVASISIRDGGYVQHPLKMIYKHKRWLRII